MDRPVMALEDSPNIRSLSRGKSPAEHSNWLAICLSAALPDLSKHKTHFIRQNSASRLHPIKGTLAPATKMIGSDTNGEQALWATARTRSKTEPGHFRAIIRPAFEIKPSKRLEYSIVKKEAYFAATKSSSHSLISQDGPLVSHTFCPSVIKAPAFATSHHNKQSHNAIAILPTDLPSQSGRLGNRLARLHPCLLAGLLLLHLIIICTPQVEAYRLSKPPARQHLIMSRQQEPQTSFAMRYPSWYSDSQEAALLELAQYEGRE
ncbi:unnamed protein product [Protopolystoma xenopodis]|uniref:Uncharacterized protein n=1 Tax=Protopolystoma xenopodis TaxID=117903 RepID=A0A448WKF2_9PLAT|nr:unnamed protein product [Protopolystoma xenopodis]